MSETAKRLEELGVILRNPRRRPPITARSRAPEPFCSSPVSSRSARTANSPSAIPASSRPKSALEPAREAARLCVVNVLAQAREALGDLDYVAQVVRLGGFFNVASSFDALPQAMNGASDLVANLFGAKGRHARNTVGVSHIPLNALAVVEAVFEIKP